MLIRRPHLRLRYAQARCKCRRSAGTVLASSLLPLAWPRDRTLHLEGFVVAGKVVISPPPLDMQSQLGCLLRGAPATARQQSHTLPQRQIQAFDEGRVELSTSPYSL